MLDESVKRILDSPVNLLRPSSETERQLLFPKNCKGVFYTIGLQSGQSFVAQFPGHNEQDDPFSLDNFAFLLRPLKNLVPQLEEVKWLFTGSIAGSGTRTICELTPETTKQERVVLENIFASHEVQSNYSGRRSYSHHEMFVKLHDVYNQLMENDRLKHALMVGQQRLHDLMIEKKDNNPANPVIRRTENERG